MLAHYVTRPNEQALAPPYDQGGCALHAFALPAERDGLQRVVDRFLAEPSDGRIRPRVDASHVLLYFCDFERSCSLDPIDARRGWLGERECGLWIPIHVPGSPAPSFFVHMMVVDSGPAMCSGREVLGFPKEIGLVGLTREPRAALLAVDVLAMGGGRSHAGRWQPLIELGRVEPPPPREGGLRELFGALGVALGSVAELLGADDGGGARPLAAARVAARGRADFINLKQLRDATEPTRACHQSVVRSSARLLGVRRIAAAGSYAYRIHDRESHPLVAELGVPATGRVHGLFCEFDFVLERGETL